MSKKFEITDIDTNVSKKKFGELWEDLLGYNPITYHDHKYLEDAYDDIYSSLPNRVQKELKNSKEEILDRAKELKEEFDDKFLRNLIIASIYEKTSYGELDDINSNLIEYIEDSDCDTDDDEDFDIDEDMWDDDLFDEDENNDDDEW